MFQVNSVYGTSVFQVGSLYEPVVTNNAGLYRYRQGDVVKVVDFYHQAPCVDFQFRSVCYRSVSTH